MKNFDDIIREKLYTEAAAFNEASWQKLEAKLPKASAASNSFKVSLFSGIAAAAILGLTLSAITNAERNKSSSSQEVILIDEIPTLTEVNENSNEEQSNTSFIPQEEHVIELLAKKDVIRQRSIEPVHHIEIVDTTVQLVSNKNDITTLDTKGENESLYDLSSFDFTAKGIECIGKEISFKIQNPIERAIASWTFDDDSKKEGTEVSHVFVSSGSHKAHVVYRFPNGQVAELEKYITVNENPVVEFYLTEELETSCFNKEVTFKAEPSNLTHQWFINNKKASNKAEFKTRLEADFYEISLSSINEFGCVSKNQKQRTVNHGIELYLPTGFTPNFDDRNNEWFPVNWDKMTSFLLQIIDPISNTLVYTTDKLEPWDGLNHKTNARVKSGEQFIAKIIAKDNCGTEKTYTEMITVPY